MIVFYIGKKIMKEDDLENLKKKLEIQKLENDIIYTRRSFYVQASNVILLVLIGIMALFFFQIPQINIMKESKLSEEKLAITKIASEEKLAVTRIAIDAMKINQDEDGKKKMLLTLSSVWIENPFINSALKEYNLTGKVDDKFLSCKQIYTEISNLSKVYDNIKEDLIAEERGGRTSNGRFANPGRGFMFYGVRQREAEVVARISSLSERAIANSCEQK
jgi:hypothetical protein